MGIAKDTCPPASAGPHRQAGKAAGGGVRLLLAEDDPTAQLVVRLVLEKSGYRVDTANNGQEALELLERQDYALVLMDCMMPLMSGYEATSVIRDHASRVRNHAIPVIAVTANAFQENRERCLAAGMDEYLVKPVDLSGLLATVRKWASFVPAEPAVFDAADFVRRNLGDLDLARDVAGLFLEHAPEDLGSIRSALASGDAALLRASTHKLKEAAATLALGPLSETASLMDRHAMAADLGRASGVLPQLEQRFDQARETLQAWLDSSRDRR